jgi:hypothetical protein
MAEEKATGKTYISSYPRFASAHDSAPLADLSLADSCFSTNRGHAGDEVEDVKGVNMANARRRSNSSTQAKAAKDFKTKFETIEPEPVFEESMAEPDEEGIRLEHQSTTSSDASDKSIEEEDKA